jgi:glycosyltransferase involved in cell wall biosynthesis
MVIPCYNKAGYIDDMFRSVCGQTYDDIELVIVNDGSDDGTREKILCWLPKFSERGFETVFIDRENTGVSKAVYNGLSCVTGGYVCICDCDDILRADYVSKMAAVLDGGAAVNWVICNIPENSILNEAVKENVLYAYLLHVMPWGVPYKLIRTSFLKECAVLESFIGSRFTQEPQINLPLALSGSAPAIINERLYVYRKIEGSIFSASIKDGEAAARFWNIQNDLILQILETHKRDSKVNKQICEIHKHHICYTYTKAQVYADGFYASVRESGLLNPPQTVFFDRLYNNYGVAAAHDYYIRSIFNLISRGAGMAEVFEREGVQITACAALSETARGFLPLFTAYVKFTRYWDIAAENGKTVNGQTVSEPDYESLRNDDIIVIFAEKPDVVDEISKKCGGAQVFRYADLCNYVYYKGSAYNEQR